MKLFHFCFLVLYLLIIGCQTNESVFNRRKYLNHFKPNKQNFEVNQKNGSHPIILSSNTKTDYHNLDLIIEEDYSILQNPEINKGHLNDNNLKINSHLLYLKPKYEKKKDKPKENKANKRGKSAYTYSLIGLISSLTIIGLLTGVGPFFILLGLVHAKISIHHGKKDPKSYTNYKRALFAIKVARFLLIIILITSSLILTFGLTNYGFLPSVVIGASLLLFLVIFLLRWTYKNIDFITESD